MTQAKKRDIALMSLKQESNYLKECIEVYSTIRDTFSEEELQNMKDQLDANEYLMELLERY